MNKLDSVLLQGHLNNNISYTSLLHTPLFGKEGLLLTVHACAKLLDIFPVKFPIKHQKNILNEYTDKEYRFITLKVVIYRALSLAS